MEWKGPESGEDGHGLHVGQAPGRDVHGLHAVPRALGAMLIIYMYRLAGGAETESRACGPRPSGGVASLGWWICAPLTAIILSRAGHTWGSF